MACARGTSSGASGMSGWAEGRKTCGMLCVLRFDPIVPPPGTTEMGNGELTSSPTGAYSQSSALLARQYSNTLSLIPCALWTKAA